MAYRAFDEGLFAPVADAPVADAQLGAADPVQNHLPFSALELSVIALSRGETVASLEPPSRIGAFIAALFAIRRANPLADPRLEALRRFAILARTAGDRLADMEVNAFLRAGFNRAQAAWLRSNARAAFFAH
ncbi:hypothetical protein [Sphingomonas cavernae]|uniref:Uncharacterized protein n=1 Tax=Sphingomonas cavernae TaxID=2320861 RepID=A0A418WNZ8_9SPHN|nr:hypothetical protein [Sphingomonas cavernae]RJF92949.1 hypothetical protein D3876_00725 [Sphingomonas cavernae]